MSRIIEKVKTNGERAKFTREFKLQAVKLMESGTKPVAQIAAELGLRRNQLYKWQLQFKAQGEATAFPGSGAKKLSEMSEVELLRRELKRVKEERDILKKAAAYFAKEMP